jgi:RNA polymerase sigma factor (sigma-70 family)
MNIIRLARTVAGKIMKLYPEADREDLVAQALLIATEKQGGYDRNAGASLETYLFQQMYDGLSDYLRRYVNKGESMRNWEDNDGISSGFVPQVEARNMIQVILENSDGTTRSVLELILEGYNNREIAELLKITEQHVCRLLKEVREKYHE